LYFGLEKAGKHRFFLQQKLKKVLTVLLELQEEKCEMKTKKQNKKTKHLFVMVRRKAKQPKSPQTGFNLVLWLELTKITSVQYKVIYTEILGVCPY
jgi:hypothetical protein